MHHWVSAREICVNTLYHAIIWHTFLHFYLASQPFEFTYIYVEITALLHNYCSDSLLQHHTMRVPLMYIMDLVYILSSPLNVRTRNWGIHDCTWIFVIQYRSSDGHAQARSQCDNSIFSAFYELLREVSISFYTSLKWFNRSNAKWN